MVRFHYLFKKKKTDTDVCSYERSVQWTEARSQHHLPLAAAVHARGLASASPNPKSGRLVVASTETMKNTIGTMVADDDSLSQRQIALVGISQTSAKKIILSLFFPAISIGCTLTLLRGMFVQAFYLHYRAYFFTGDVTNSGLHAAFFTFSINGISDT